MSAKDRNSVKRPGPAAYALLLLLSCIAHTQRGRRTGDNIVVPSIAEHVSPRTLALRT